MARTRSVAVWIGVAVVGLAGACAEKRDSPPVPPERFSAVLTGTLATSYAVELSWTSPAWADGFAVEVSADGGPWFPVGTAGPQVRRATVSFPPDLPDATALVFRIRTELGGRPSPWVETSVSFAVRPASRVAVEPSGGAFQLSWYRHALVADEVRLERRLVAHGGEVTPLAVVRLPADATTYLDGDLAAWVDGGRIRYAVVYVRRGVDSPRVELDSPAAPPTAPAGLVATADDRTVRLTWTNRSASAARIEIRMKVFPGTSTTTGSPVATLLPDTELFEHTREDYGIAQYTIEAVSDDGGRGAADVSAVTASPELLQVFELRIVELPDATVAAGDPDVGWLLAHRTAGLLPVPGGWEKRAFASADPAAAMTAGGGVLARANSNIIDISTLGTEGWTDGSISTTNLADIGAAVAGGNAAVAWQAWAPDPSGQTVTSYGYADLRGGWEPELVTCDATIEPRTDGLRLGPDGEPAMLDVSRNRLIVRRSGGAWTCEPIPQVDPTDPVHLGDPLALAPTEGGGALVIAEGFRALYALERDAAGWHAPTLIAEDFFASPTMSVGVAADGRALALLDDRGLTVPRGVFLRGLDGTWTHLPLLPNASAISGFDSNGKAWVLDGLAMTYQTTFAERRPYALFVER